MDAQLRGHLRMAGEEWPGVSAVISLVDDEIEIDIGDSAVGRWPVSEVGIIPLQEGFRLRAEGEEMILTTDDDAVFAAAVGIRTGPPRLTRLITRALEHPEEHPAQPSTHVSPPEPAGLQPPGPQDIRSVVTSAAKSLVRPRVSVPLFLFVLGGLLVVVGGIVLIPPLAGGGSNGSSWWPAFVLGGLLMLAAGAVMAMRTPAARNLAIVSILVVFALLALAASAVPSIGDQARLMGYWLVGGGAAAAAAALALDSVFGPGD